MPLVRGLLIGRTVIEGRTNQVADMQAEAEQYPEGREVALRLGWRTGLGVPLLHDISGSAHWYNAADHGVIVSGDTTSNVREITVEKSRYRSAGIPGSGWLKLENGRLRPTVAP